MTIEYRGMNKEEGINYREAVICYDEEKEQQKADRLFDILSKMGWDGYGEEGVLAFKVFDKDEYKVFVADYKKVKKEV